MLETNFEKKKTCLLDWETFSMYICKIRELEFDLFSDKTLIKFDNQIHSNLKFLINLFRIS